MECARSQFEKILSRGDGLYQVSFRNDFITVGEWTVPGLRFEIILSRGGDRLCQVSDSK